MNSSAQQMPGFRGVDHISWSVPDLQAAIDFYVGVIGATEIYRLGPFDAAEIPPEADGRDWMAAHVGVPGARLTLAMLQLGPTMKFQLAQYDAPVSATAAPPRNNDRGGHHLGLLVQDVQAAAAHLKAHGCTVLEPIVMTEGPLAGKTNLYVLDPWGHQLELVD